MTSTDYENLVKNILLSAYIRENISVEEKRNKIETIISQGADVNFKDANDKNNTALHVAVALEELEIVTLLLYRGANVYHKNTDKKTPLDLAKNIKSEVGKEIESAIRAKIKFKEDLPENTSVVNNIKSCIEDVENRNEIVSSVKPNPPSYNKRAGTSGVTGQLYETKILSLVMLKASTDQDIQNFYLGTNINGIGAFDDLCFRYKLNDYDKDIMVLLQAKHRDDPETRKLTISDIRNTVGDFCLPKYLDSYSKIKAKFNSKNQDPMFAGEFSNIECNCILYTPSKDMIDDSLKTFKEPSLKINEFLNTHTLNDGESKANDKSIFQFKYSDVDIEFLAKFMVEEKIKNLGVTLMDFIINNEKFNNMLTDELIRTYHVVLAQEIIDVSAKTPSGMFRVGRFRLDFFYSNDYYVSLLRISCYRELVTTHAKALKLRKKETRKLLQQMLVSPTGVTLSKLFGTILTYNEKSNKLELIEDNMKAFKQDDVKEFRENIKNIQFNDRLINNRLLNEAIETLCKEELVKKEFKIPNAFGNLDMTIRSGSKDNKKDEKSVDVNKKTKNKKGNQNSTVNNNIKEEINLNQNSDYLKSENKLEIKACAEEPTNILKDKFNQRLDHLTSKFEVLFQNFQKSKLINIDDSIVGNKKLLEEGFLDINGGIGGAVGNLLILNNKTGFLQFNKDCTADTATKFLLKLKAVLPNKLGMDKECKDSLNKENVKDEIENYSLNIMISNFPRLSFSVNSYDKLITRNFLNSLWFYTSQAKEDKVESILKKQIDVRYNFGRRDNIFRIHSDAIFLRFHDEIQKWWMLPGQVPYLTNETKIFDKINKFVVENPLLTVLNAMYLNKIKKLGIEYKIESVKTLQLDMYSEKIVNVVTDFSALSGIKIGQYYQRKDHTFIDFDYILSLPEADFDKMIDELKLTKIKTLIIVYEAPSKKYGINEKLINIINNFSLLDQSKIIIITNNVLAKEIQFRYTTKYVSFNDENISLSDLTNKSQTKILQEAKVLFQDEEVDLLPFISHKSKQFLNTKMLWKLINNEKIDIGKKIEVRTYNKYSIDKIDCSKRTLKLLDTYEVESLGDIEDDVVVITAKPAMGKSKLLKNLALETKKESPYIWIPIINFNNCGVSFCRWQDEKRDTSFREVFKLLCELVLKNDVTYLDFDVEKEDDKVKLINCEDIDSLVMFELQIFVDFYNENNIIFLFDDFDDVCPPYEKEALTILNTIQGDNNKLWITSRSYPAPKFVLEREFGDSYTLMPLDQASQIGFLSRFFQTNIKLEKLNNEQFSNLSSLLKYVSNMKGFQEDQRHMIPLISLPIHLIYIVAIHFFQSELNNITSTTVRNTLKDRLDFDIDAWGTLSTLTSENSSEVEEAMELAGTPLHMYIAANYFQLQLNESIKIIVDKNEIIQKWDIITNAVTLYKQFLESTLKGMCFDRRDISDEDAEENNQVKMRQEFMEKHKKVLLYTICKEEHLNQLLPKEEIDELRETIFGIQKGEIRSGAIECVLNDVPRFFHLMFAEYFIVEVLVDMLKSFRQGDLIDLRKHKAVWDFIINILLFNSPPSIRKVFNYKLKNDPELQEMTCNDYCREIVFELLLKQNDPSQPSTSSAPNNYTLKLAMADGLTYLVEFLITCIKDNLNKDNVHKFVDMLKSSELTRTSLGPEHKVFFDTILDIVKHVDAEKLFDLVASPSFVEVPTRLVALAGNDEITETVRSQLTLAREQLTAASGELFGISRDTSNLLRGIFRVLTEDLRK